MAFGSVPLCDDCWLKENGDRVPYRMIEAMGEVCYSCGMPTMSGIYVRKELKKLSSSGGE